MHSPQGARASSRKQSRFAALPSSHQRRPGRDLPLRWQRPRPLAQHSQPPTPTHRGSLRGSPASSTGVGAGGGSSQCVPARVRVALHLSRSPARRPRPGTITACLRVLPARVPFLVLLHPEVLGTTPHPDPPRTPRTPGTPGHSASAGSRSVYRTERQSPAPQGGAQPA